MTNSQSIIPIISGWNYISFQTDTIPSDRMLAQLLRPNVDLDSAALHWHEMSEFDNIPDLDSQLKLQAWSNYVILQMCVRSDDPVKQENADVMSNFISDLSKANNINHSEPLYHHNVMRYLHNLIPGKSNLNHKKILDLFQQLGTDFMKSGRSEFTQVEGESKLSKDRHEHCLDLGRRFVDYKMSDDCLDSFYHYVFKEEESDKIILDFLRSSRNKLDQFKKDARNSYRAPTQKIDTDSIPMAVQCRGCGKWLAQSQSQNGKLLAHGCFDCEKERDRQRKRKSDQGWVKDSDVRKYCSIMDCGLLRLVDIDRVCRKCFNNNKASQASLKLKSRLEEKV
jgi:hypothetical protein